MLKRYTFWLKTAVFFLILTAAFHSLSFVVTPELHNDTERQLHDLINNYHPDMGLGFHPSFWNLFTALSSCFTFVCLLGGLTLGYLMRKQLDPKVMRGVIGIHLAIFAAMFVVMLFLTFIIPVVCTGLIFVSLLAAFITAPKISAGV